MFKLKSYPPSSSRFQKETFENKDIYFEPLDGFSLDDVHHALDLIAENKEPLQEWIYKCSEKLCARDLSVSHFDCTNYYFDIGCPEKNHRPDPIVTDRRLNTSDNIYFMNGDNKGDTSYSDILVPLLRSIPHFLSDLLRIPDVPFLHLD